MDSTDILAEVESFVASWLGADTDVSANTIETKIKDATKNRRKAALPAIGIVCDEILSENDGVWTVNGSCVILAAGTNDANITTIKRVVAEVFYSFTKSFVPGYNLTSYAMQMKPTRGKVDLLSASEKTFTTQGLVEFSVILKECRV